MTETQAKAEIFWTAFRSLKKRERSAVVQRLLQDDEMREDVRYALIIDERKNEEKIPLDDYLVQHSKKRP